jgi:hypothetical protein
MGSEISLPYSQDPANSEALCNISYKLFLDVRPTSELEDPFHGFLDYLKTLFQLWSLYCIEWYEKMFMAGE